MIASHRLRLDQALVQRGVVETRSKARDLIVRGAVRVSGEVVRKPGTLIGPDDDVQADIAQHPYVSRGGLKLAHALDVFDYSPLGVCVVDVGASTGGFTDVLLRRGASRVYAVDVGHDQLHDTLSGDDRVVALDGTDVRMLTGEMVQEPVSAIVSDVSFISLTQVLPAAMQFAAPGCWLVALIKPQFELDPKAIGKGGIVTSEQARQTSIDKIVAWFSECVGWRAASPIQSPITGKGGNIEFLIGARFDG